MDRIHENIAAELNNFGGHLECTICGTTKPLGSIATKLATGWPKHCGYTMTWKTARQLAT